MLILAALILTFYNYYENMQAANAVTDVLREIRGESSLISETDAGRKPDTKEEQENAEPEIPDYLRDPLMDMPSKEIIGEEYIGVVDIPTLKLGLPVISEWSYARLKKSPCRYQGSVYQDDLIIMAHNYSSHFGNLVNLKIGDKLYFTDMEERVFAYEVVEVESLEETAVKDMTSGDWDLTLFTCTISGEARVTVRCDRLE